MQSALAQTLRNLDFIVSHIECRIHIHVIITEANDRVFSLEVVVRLSVRVRVCVVCDVGTCIFANWIIVIDMLQPRDALIEILNVFLLLHLPVDKGQFFVCLFACYARVQ